MAAGDIFVANCTRQNAIVYFRVDFDEKGTKHAFKPPNQKSILAGQQGLLVRDQHPYTVDSIVKQLQVYGAKAALDLRQGNLGSGVVPYLFNLGQELKAADIRAVMDHNHRVKLIDGKDRRRNAAIASNNMLERTVESQIAAMDPSGQMPQPDLRAATVDFEQVAGQEEGQDGLGEGFHLNKGAPVNQPPPPARKKPGPKAGSRRRQAA